MVSRSLALGNIMVVGFVLKDCVGGNDPYSDADQIINFDPETGLRITNQPL